MLPNNASDRGSGDNEERVQYAKLSALEQIDYLMSKIEMVERSKTAGHAAL